MPILNQTTSQSSIKLFLNSANATRSVSDSHKWYVLLDPIRAMSGHHIMLNILDAEISNSFYQTNETNNTFSGTIGGGAFNFTIPQGCYTAHEICTEINTQFTSAGLTCTLTYSNITNRITITCNNAVAIVLSANSSVLSQLGFSSTNLTGTTSLGGDKSVDLKPIKNIYLKILNLNIHNKYNGSTSKIVAKIPIDKERYSIIYYKQHSSISSEIYDRVVDVLEFAFCDEAGEEVAFGREDAWSICLGFVYHIPKKYENKTLTVQEEMRYLEDT